MAYIRDYNVTVGDVNSITPGSFTSESGDLILMFVQREATGETWGTPTGYTAETNLDSGWGTSSLFSKVAGSSETPQSSSITTVGETVCYLWVIADVAASTPIEIKKIDAVNIKDAQTANVSTTVNDTLNIHHNFIFPISSKLLTTIVIPLL